MSESGLSALHTVDDEWLASYAAGALSAPKRVVIACQAAMEPRLAARLLKLDHVGGVFLTESRR